MRRGVLLTCLGSPIAAAPQIFQLLALDQGAQPDGVVPSAGNAKDTP